MTTTTQTFTGFRPEAIQFLADLADNNERSWFQPRKGDFERLLKGPLEALCVALDERFRERGIPLSADPAQLTVPDLSRRPVLEGQVAVQDAHQRVVPVRSTATPRPGGYFHLSPGEIYVGGGMWHPDRARLARLAGARRSRRRSRGARRPGVRGDVRLRRRRLAAAASRRASPRTIRAPTCSSSRTSRSVVACRTTTRPRPTCRTSSPTRSRARSRSSACWAGCPTRRQAVPTSASICSPAPGQGPRYPAATESRRVRRYNRADTDCDPDRGRPRVAAALEGPAR